MRVLRHREEKLSSLISDITKAEAIGGDVERPFDMTSLTGNTFAWLVTSWLPTHPVLAERCRPHERVLLKPVIHRREA
jgi:hypothetical protein